MKKNIIIYFILFIIISSCSYEKRSETTSPEAPTPKRKTETSKTSESEVESIFINKKSLSKTLKEETGGEKPTLLGKEEIKTEKYSIVEKGIENDKLPKAGEHDDNEEYQYFIKFLDEKFNISMLESLKERCINRIILSINDKNNLPLYSATANINNKNYKTYADGEILISTIKPNDLKNVKISYNNYITNISITPNQIGRYNIKLDLEREILKKVPIDIVFLMDTTGSMEDEIDILRDTIYSIYMRINKLQVQNLDLRFGMVLYRDKEDIYVTKEFDLTPDISKFQNFLFTVEAGGGGDYPEDLLSGLNKTINSLNWNPNAIKLVFLITDAPAHIDSSKYFENLIDKAIEKNIKIFSIGASGLDLEGEIQLRILSQQTKGKFIFLTYGEKGESEGAGTSEDLGKVSHHTGANYESRNLDDIVVDNVKKEIYHQLPIKELEIVHKDYDYKKEEDKIYRRVDNAIQQIKKQIYLDKKINSNYTVLVLEPNYDDNSLKNLASYIYTISETIINNEKILKTVDRSKLQIVIDELKLKLSGLTTKQTENIKEIIHADTILTGNLYYIGNSTVIYMKLIDAETTEVLAASMVKI